MSAQTPFRHSLLALLAAAVVMTVFESTKQWFLPGITLWQSHTLTIVVSSCLAAVAAFFVSSEHEVLHHRTLIEATARQQADAERDRFFSLAQDMLCIASTDGYFKRVNPAFSQTLGWRDEELLARPAIEFGHPDDREASLREAERLAAGEPTIYFENRFRCKDGSWKWLAWKTMPQPDGQLYATARDVTENKRIAEQMARNLQELEESNKELEAFSYTVSHDLRAPLRHVQGYVEMLQRATEGQLSEKAQRFVKTIADASGDMGQLIDDLLAFSRMGRVGMNEGIVEFEGLVQEALRNLEMAVRERHIEWNIAALPRVSGDEALLRQVLVNLLGNAVKYSRTRDPARIEIGCAGHEKGRIICFVRDNGAGFDMQYAHKLFGVFQRLHRAEEFEGTGIGLANVRRIIVRHGGRVWAEGKPGEGATFYFTLKPAATA